MTTRRLIKINDDHGNKWEMQNWNAGIHTSSFKAATYQELKDRYPILGVDINSLEIGKELFIC